MSYGYDVAELLSDIKAKDAEIRRLTPNNFTEEEARVCLETMIEFLDVNHPDVASAIRKLQAVCDRQRERLPPPGAAHRRGVSARTGPPGREPEARVAS